MSESARFRVAVHVLTLLAHETGRALTSAYIAGSVNTSPVVVRRILRQLARAGLVSSTEGAAGGTVLKRRPARITLLDVHRAVEPGDLFGETRRPPNPRCPVGRSVQKVLDGHAERLRAALGDKMDQITVADVLAGVRRRKRA